MSAPLKPIGPCQVRTDACGGFGIRYVRLRVPGTVRTFEDQIKAMCLNCRLKMWGEFRNVRPGELSQRAML